MYEPLVEDSTLTFEMGNKVRIKMETNRGKGGRKTSIFYELSVLMLASGNSKKIMRKLVKDKQTPSTTPFTYVS